MPLFTVTRGDKTITVLKPKPPKIGSAYVRSVGKEHSHSADQNWVQDLFPIRHQLRNPKLNRKTEE